jgi:hypothetical protein
MFVIALTTPLPVLAITPAEMFARSAALPHRQKAMIAAVGFLSTEKTSAKGGRPEARQDRGDGIYR